MENKEKTNWAQVGYFISAFASFFLVWGFFIDTPSYESLERVQGKLEKHEIIRTPQGVGTRWLFIRDGEKQVSACMPQLGNLDRIEELGRDVWILGVPSFTCDFRILEIGTGTETIVSYNYFTKRENKIARKMKLFLWPAFIAGMLLVLFQRFKSNKCRLGTR